MRTFRYDTTVLPDQVDVLGHLNNAAYLAIFEAARWATLGEVGTPWSALVEAGVSPVVLSADVRFRKEVRQGETLHVETRYEPRSPRRFVVHHRMLDEGDVLRASAQIQAGFLDVKARKLCSPSPEVLAALGVQPAEMPAEPVVQGLGGAFLYCSDVEAVAAWWTSRFGLRLQNWGKARGLQWPSADVVPSRRESGTVFALFQAEGPVAAEKTGRVNLRVGDLDAVVASLRAAGDRVEVGADEGYGRFAWTYDPEGNRVELWQPGEE
jgi:acyl-CoA thioester hydrolase